MATAEVWPPWFSQPIPQHKLPISHRQVTIHGAVITFQILAYLAVAVRIYYRCFTTTHAFGWDDVFVICSLFTTTVNTILTAMATKYGMGQHYGVVEKDPAMLTNWYKLYFFAALFYFLSAALIKNSILFQYLRMFKEQEHRVPRMVCIGFIIFVSIWGTLFFFIQLFSCWPVSDAWSTASIVNCHLLMSFNLYHWLAGIITHAVTNMILDYLILCIPILFRRHLKIESRGRSALIALFTFGGCVATISAVRLILIIAYKGGVHPSEDASWYAPAIMIPSAVEIQTAVICASTPIFWPMVAKALRLDQIIVTREVVLHSETRSGAPGLRGWKRHSESSETELRDQTGAESGNHSAPEVNEHAIDSKDSYISGRQVTGETILDPDLGHRAIARSLSFPSKKKPATAHFETIEKQ